MNKFLDNFYKCIQNHPQFHETGKLFIGYTEKYKYITQMIYDRFAEINPSLQQNYLKLETNDTFLTRSLIDQSNLFILFYDSDYSQPLGRPVIIQQLFHELKKHWKKSCIIKNYGKHFNEAFGICPLQQQRINNTLLTMAAKAEHLYYRDKLGSDLEINIQNAKWTSVCGCGNLDLVPGEIATLGVVNGVVKFTGAFLSVIPFAPKYGILHEPLTLEIKNNVIVNFEFKGLSLMTDFKKYIQYNSSNSTIEEVGIGSNPYVKLHGINAGFEERHVGLHLGLGGAKAGSDHLDLIFKDGCLSFDNDKFIENETILT